MNYRFREKLILVVLWIFMLYSTGVVHVFADFWRTFDWGKYVGYKDVPASMFTYGYGYGDLGWWYGYGYWYGYGNYEAGFMIKLADSYSVVTIPSSFVQSSNTSDIVTGSITVASVLSNLWLSVDTIKKIQNLPAILVSQVEEPFDLGGWKQLHIDLPEDLIIYVAWNVVPEIKKEVVNVNAEDIPDISDVKWAVEIGDPNAVLIFNKPVTITLSNVWNDVNKFCYKLSNSSNWNCLNLQNSNCTPDVWKECAYLNWDDLVIKTYHFTTFVVGKEEVGSSGGSWWWSSSSSGGWGWGWGGGWWWGWGGRWWYSVKNKTKTTTTTKTKTTISFKTPSSVKNLVNKIKFKTTKFKRAISLINKIAFDILENAYLIGGESLVEKLWRSYYYVIKYLAKYESKEISKKEVISKLKAFLKYYNQYKQEFGKVVSKEYVVIKGIKVENWNVKFKNWKVAKLVKLLDKKIEEEMRKDKYSPKDVKEFYKNYNKFKLAVRYMKEVDRKVGLSYAKKYLKNMLQILKK